MKRFLLVAQWITIPLLVFALAEYSVKRWVEKQTNWYPAYGQPGAEGKQVNYIFIGSSHVGAAIDAKTFAKAMGEHLNRSCQALNFGRGFSKPVQHLLGLRNLFTMQPGASRGVTVFVEAPAGLPVYDTFADDWYFPQATHMLVSRLASEDLTMYRKHHPNWSQQATLLRLYACRPSNLMRNRNYIRRLVFRRSRQKLDALFPAREANILEHDLDQAGGVRNDAAGVKIVREQIKVEVDSVEKKMIPPLEKTVLMEIRTLVESVGGRVVLYDIPLSGIKRATFTGMASEADRTRFRNALAAEGIPVLRSKFSYDDADFPDLSHLRKSRKKEFTRHLADAYWTWHKTQAQP